VSAVDRCVGRKGIVLCSAGLFCVGALLMAVCPTNAFGLLVVGRIVVGLGIGASSTIVPVCVGVMRVCVEGGGGVGGGASVGGSYTTRSPAFCA
jgi:MFS family permease